MRRDFFIKTSSYIEHLNSGVNRAIPTLQLSKVVFPVPMICQRLGVSIVRVPIHYFPISRSPPQGNFLNFPDFLQLLFHKLNVPKSSEESWAVSEDTCNLSTSTRRYFFLFFKPASTLMLYPLIFFLRSLALNYQLPIEVLA